MRLLYLCKRRYMRRDVVSERYGRLYELPRHLAGKHEIRLIAVDYRPSLGLHRVSRIEDDNGLVWITLRANLFVLPTLLQYLSAVRREFRQHRPDVVVGTSDSLQIVLADILSRIYRVPVVQDLYDNFEVFSLSRLPGLTSLYRRALGRADAVTCVSERLREHVERRHRPGKTTLAVESTIDRAAFHPVDRTDARRQLGLPLDVPCIGTAGALHRNRDIQTVYDAFLAVVKARPEVRLVLAGSIDAEAPPPRHDNVIHLGDLPHERMNTFFNSLDLAFNYMADDDFGRYAFPQKASEMLAARVPVLSARVGVFGDLINDDRFLYASGNAEELAAKILALLDAPAVPDVTLPEWSDQAKRVDGLLEDVIAQ